MRSTASHNRPEKHAVRVPAYSAFIRLNAVMLCIAFMPVMLTACGRKGDPFQRIPYAEVGVVRDLKAVPGGGHFHLTWGEPEGKDFPSRAVKGFILFRSEVPEGVTLKECDCKYRYLDFVVTDRKASRAQDEQRARKQRPSFEYIDRKVVPHTAYAYKIVVMDRNDKMGKDSNIVLTAPERAVPMKEIRLKPTAPSGLVALYARNSIVLTWNEIKGMGIRNYRVYRSAGGGFQLVGEVATPVFTDKAVEKNRTYYYKVSAVGKEEGPVSVQLEVSTEVR